jgi:hypothetical protein
MIQREGRTFFGEVSPLCKKLWRTQCNVVPVPGCNNRYICAGESTSQIEEPLFYIIGSEMGSSPGL